MNRQTQLVHRRNARVVATGLRSEVREAVYAERYAPRAARPPSGLNATERTLFSAVRAALEMAEGYARVPGDNRQRERDSYTIAAELQVDINPTVIDRAVRLLHDLVPCGDDVVARAAIVRLMEPATVAERDLWPLMVSAAQHLAGEAPTSPELKPSAEIIAAEAAYGRTLDQILATSHPLAVAATLHSWIGPPDRRRFLETAELFSRCFVGYAVDIDAWTATTTIWHDRYIETSALLILEAAAYREMDLVADRPLREVQAIWREHVQPLARVNAALRRLSRLGADVGDLLLLPTEPRPELSRLRPASDLFATENLSRLIQLGLEVLDDPIELWAWQNLWSRGCRPQACLPLIDELIPFDEGRWRVLVPAAYSKTGLIVDFVSTPLAELTGWSPSVCPKFVRSRSARDGVVPTLVAGNACRRVRREWKRLQRQGVDLPDLPDRLAYMTRKLLALWLAQRLSTAAFTRWMSHSTAATNQPYAQPTIDQLLAVRHAQGEARP
jgi:hypothetical protein